MWTEIEALIKAVCSMVILYLSVTVGTKSVYVIHRYRAYLKMRKRGPDLIQHVILVAGSLSILMALETGQVIWGLYQWPHFPLLISVPLLIACLWMARRGLIHLTEYQNRREEAFLSRENGREPETPTPIPPLPPTDPPKVRKPRKRV